MTHRMSFLASLASAAAALVALAGSASAQTAPEWLKFGTKAPTAADWAAVAKLPDLNGVWEATSVGAARGRGAAAAAAEVFGPRSGRAGAPAAGGARRAGGPPRDPQLTPAYAAKKAALQARKAEDTDSANCVPPGMPGVMTQPYPYEFLLTPGLVTIVGEAYMQVRHVYTDGRPLPADADPTFNGTSVGHWEGDTLVVQSVGFTDSTMLAANTPHSDKMRVEERFRLSGPDTMTMQTTVTDPEALTEPWVTTRTLARHRNWTIREYICEENNRNYVDDQGKAGIKLDEPPALPKDKE
jgi:hypothetical protein